MIKKLMKHDTRKMFWILCYIYIISVTLAGLTRLINIGNNIQFLKILGHVFSGLTYSALCSILVNTFVQILRVFTLSFYKDESYLTHTLPVSKNKLLLSKYLSAIIVIMTSILVCFASLFIMFYSKTFIQGLKSFISATVSGFNISIGLFVFLLILLIFAEICAFISMSFTAIVKAHTYNSKRVLKGMLWFVLYYLGSMVCLILTCVIIFAISGNISSLFASTLSSSAFLKIIILTLIFYISLAILYYFICRKVFKKGVNVD